MIAPGWDALELTVRFRGSRVRVRIQADAVEASADPPLNALPPAGERVRLTGNSRTFELSPPSPRRSV